MSEAPIRVLFLCTGNSARSQIAEALLQRAGGDRFVVASAGTQPAARVHPDAVRALSRVGISWRDRVPKLVESIKDQGWDLVITVCDHAKESCPFIPGVPSMLHWGVPDPAAIDDADMREQAFADTVSVLSQRVDSFVSNSRAEMYESAKLARE